MKSVPSSITYNKYLISSFEKLPDTRVRVLSSTISKNKFYCTKKTVQNGKHDETYFRSIPNSWGKYAVRLSLLGLYAQLFCYLLFRARKDDVVIIYHGHGLAPFYKFFRRFLRSKLVYIVGEIFSAVWDLGDEEIKRECSYLMNADGYIFVNDIMPRLFKAEQKSVVCYGSYDYSETEKINDSQIHVLYAGKITTGIINDAFMALDVIKYLPEKYMLHIAGYGEDADIRELINRIDAINAEKNCKRVIYEGNLSGEDYDSLLAKCRIGLCTRTLRNELSNYCFPSKTLVYLTHDLLPVCPKIDILIESKIAERLSFVEGELNPENIAQTIEIASEKLKHYNNEEIIKQIDNMFVNDLKNII